MEESSQIKALVWDWRGTRLVSVNDDGSAQEVLFVEEAVPLAALRITVGVDAESFKLQGIGLQAVDWSPDGRHIACALGDGTVRIVDLLARRTRLTYDQHRELFPAWPLAVAWSPYGKLIASGGTDRSVRIWEATTGDSVIAHSGYSAESGHGRGHKEDITTVAWSPDSEYVASGSRDGTVIVLSLKQKTGPLWRMHEGEVTSLAWSPDGTALASAGKDALVQVWYPGANKRVHVYHGHTDGVTALAWSPDGRFIASGSLDGSVQIWQATTGTCVARYSESYEIHALSWSKTGLLAYEGPQGSVRLVLFQASLQENVTVAGGCFDEH